MTSRIAVILLIGLLASVLSYQAGATRAILLRPVSVGTVDLGRVLEETNQRAEWDARVKAEEEQIGAELRSRQEALNKKKERLDALPEGPEKATLREEMAFDIIQAENWSKFKQATLDRERAVMWQDLYRAVRTEAEALAGTEGIDLVLVNDGVNELRSMNDPNVSAEAATLQQISMRRVLFAQKEIDITDRLIVRINNARMTNR